MKLSKEAEKKFKELIQAMMKQRKGTAILYTSGEKKFLITRIEK